MELILQNARIEDESPSTTDIGVDDGRIVAIRPGLESETAETLDVGGRLVSPGFVESHIHLDKSRILDRCRSGTGSLEEAIGEVARAKRDFSPEDVYRRAKETLERSILNGTTYMRTHLEVDPTIGLRALEGVLPLVTEYAWAIDLEICVFPQDGMLNLPGTEALMIGALERGSSVVGGCPYTDSDPTGQIDRVFEIARDFDVDIDMHLDFHLDPGTGDLEYVCDKTDRLGYGGRVAVGHVTNLSAMAPARLDAAAKRMADAGVSLTVLPSTDLFLMGRDHDHSTPRGVTPAHGLLRHGVNCSLSTNNVLNPFTPFGDGSLIRMANLYANVCQVGARADVIECFRMITDRPARLMRLGEYGVAVGNPMDLVVLDCVDRANAIAGLAQPLWGFKRGRRTFTWPAAELHRPAR